MGKRHLSSPRLRLLFAVLIGICLFRPPDLFAKNMSDEKRIMAQTVTGTITDASNGTPLSGATIAVRGSNVSTNSDAKGAFTISVPDNNSVLVISFVGYTTREVAVGSNTQIDIALQPSTADLAQVVVVGYGTQNKRDVTGSVKSLKSEAFNKG